MEDHYGLPYPDEKTERDRGVILQRLDDLETICERLHKEVSSLEMALRPIIPGPTENTITGRKEDGVTLQALPAGDSQVAQAINNRIASLTNLADHVAWLRNRVEV